jgi:thioredoxin:protein disulfide reductase
LLPRTRSFAMRHKSVAAAGLWLALFLSAPLLAQDASAPASPPAPKSGIDAVLGAAKSGDTFLPVEKAFHLDALAEGSDRVRLNWQIAPGYYLYRARIKVTSTSTTAQLGTPEFPPGTVKADEYFGKQVIYHDTLSATVPVARTRGGTLELPLTVTYQGCAEAGLCYPPVTTSVTVQLGAGAGAALTSPGSSAGTGLGGEQDRFAELIRHGSLATMLGWFYVAGLLLAFTPCVLPMVPILSGIIAGAGAHVTTSRAFSLSLTYVLGMALTYTVAGIACAAAGEQVQAVFQKWWVLLLFAALFVALALSMFGVFTLQMPAAIQSRIATLSNRQSAGTFGGVAVMGALSALIVTTCVGPALVGALLVISQSGQMVRGGAALFAMSIGMGTPLLVVGASAGRLLPKAGLWMEFVKKIFGVLMLAVAALILARLVPDWAGLLLWAVPALALALLLWLQARATRGRVLGWRAAGALAALYGVALIAGAALGGTDPLRPIPLGAKTDALPFQAVTSLAQLERQVAQAHAQGRGVLLDFTAAWCTSCHEMDRYTFTDPRVRAALHDAVLLRADVTANSAEDQALLKHLSVVGPPTIVFFGVDGEERAVYRVVGYMSADAFAARTRSALHASS